MSRKATLPIAAIFMIVVIALAALGVAYGLWYEVLWVYGHVATGDVDIEFVDVQTEECVDIGIWHYGDNSNGEAIVNSDGGNNHAGWFEVTEECVERPDKDTVDCEAWLDPIHGNDSLVFAVSGLYPSWHCKIGFHVKSTGSVPVHVIPPYPVDLAHGEPELPEGVLSVSGCWDEPVQLHKNEVSEKCWLEFHIDNSYPENTTLGYIKGEIVGHQWNETPVLVEPIRVESPPLSYGPTGWGGWSCPAGTHVVGGGFEPPTATVLVSEAAEPGSVSGLYPVYPHYTYTPPETGWVVQNDNDSETITVYALCLPDAPP